MAAPPFVSYAQNAEDVVLWRALHGVPQGCYVEVGANHPTDHSVSRAFYDRGWSGVCIEPVPAFAEAFRRERPRDVVVQEAVSEQSGEVVLHSVPDTGLSTLRDDIGAQHGRSGWPVEDVVVRSRRLDEVLDEHVHGDIHFLLVDTEGFEREVLSSVDLTRWRPWVLVIEATAPMSSDLVHERWEPVVLAADYEFCLFDGISRYYVAREHAADLGPALSFPACALDLWLPRATYELQQQVDQVRGEVSSLVGEVVRWRGEVLDQWSRAAETALVEPGVGGQPGREAARLRSELEALQATLSWRVTRPLRVARTRQLRTSTRL